MDFELNRENRMILDAVADWMARECPEESVRQWEETGGAPESLRKKFSELGFTGLSVPEAYEGEGPDYLGSTLVTEALASRYAALARDYGSITFYGGAAVNELGSGAQKSAFLPAFARGENAAALLFCSADSEAETQQEPLPVCSEKNGHTEISGSGWCLGSAKKGDRLLFAALAGAEDPPSIRLYCIETDRPGLHITPGATLGYTGNTMAHVFLQNLPVQPADRLGQGGRDAWATLRGLLHLELGAEALGIARGSLSYAAGYARRRIQFGRPIVRFPAIRDMIIQNECDIQAAAMLLYRAASAADSKKPWMGDAARAYYAACRTARKTALDGLQILGGYGYTMEFAAQRYVRDAMSLYNTGAESEEVKSLIAEKAGFQAG